jgi:NADPH-dependent 2,4-dienoyl-CoA reductase/sulfur reductase-like enzyme
MMTRFELLIVGGGLAAARAIREYRAAGGGGRIALLAKERTLPYHRPPLSKRFLRGEVERNQTLVEPQAFYEESDVELLLGSEVISVEPRERTVVTSDGSRYRYRKLLLATGATPRALEIPGADFEGVFSLRSLDDAAAIREAAADARDAVVIGSGFIGMEVAASLKELGLDVTLVSRDVDLFAQLRSPEVSEHLVDLYRRRGVDIIRGDAVRAFRGRSRLDTVEPHAGAPLAATLAVVAVGVGPAVSFLEGSGIAVEDGILVDERFETNRPGVYAVGDVARFYDPVFGRRRRIEHWSNANYHGTQVGKVLAGMEEKYDAVSTFFTESFGLTLHVLGDISQHDDRVARGSFTDGIAIVFYFADGRLVATLHAGQDDETENQLMELVGGRAAPSDMIALADESIPLSEGFATPAEAGVAS